MINHKINTYSNLILALASAVSMNFYSCSPKTDKFNSSRVREEVIKAKIFDLDIEKSIYKSRLGQTYTGVIRFQVGNDNNHIVKTGILLEDKMNEFKYKFHRGDSINIYNCTGNFCIVNIDDIVVTYSKDSNKK